MKVFVCVKDEHMHFFKTTANLS